jgi:hypothetical protein
MAGFAGGFAAEEASQTVNRWRAGFVPDALALLASGRNRAPLQRLKPMGGIKTGSDIWDAEPVAVFGSAFCFSMGAVRLTAS